MSSENQPKFDYRILRRANVGGFRAELALQGACRYILLTSEVDFQANRPAIRMGLSGSSMYYDFWLKAIVANEKLPDLVKDLHYELVCKPHLPMNFLTQWQQELVEPPKPAVQDSLPSSLVARHVFGFVLSDAGAEQITDDEISRDVVAEIGDEVDELLLEQERLMLAMVETDDSPTSTYRTTKIAQISRRQDFLQGCLDEWHRALTQQVFGVAPSDLQFWRVAADASICEGSHTSPGDVVFGADIGRIPWPKEQFAALAKLQEMGATWHSWVAEPKPPLY